MHSRKQLYPSRLQPNCRVRATILTSGRDLEYVDDLFAYCETLSPCARQLAAELSDMSPVEMLDRALRVTMFRLSESAGGAPWPCLSAEEQVFIEEVYMTSAPDHICNAAHSVLFIPERIAHARSMRKAVGELTNGSTHD